MQIGATRIDSPALQTRATSIASPALSTSEKRQRSPNKTQVQVKRPKTIDGDFRPLEESDDNYTVTRNVVDMIKASTALSDKAYRCAEKSLAELVASQRLTIMNALTTIRYIESHITECQQMMMRAQRVFEDGNRQFQDLVKSEDWEMALKTRGQFESSDDIVLDPWGDKPDVQDIREAIAGGLTRMAMKVNFDHFKDWEQATESIPITERHGFLDDNCSILIEQYRHAQANPDASQTETLNEIELLVQSYKESVAAKLHRMRVLR
jgi:hypothetical protein